LHKGEKGPLAKEEGKKKRGEGWKNIYLRKAEKSLGEGGFGGRGDFFQRGRTAVVESEGFSHEEGIFPFLPLFAKKSFGTRKVKRSKEREEGLRGREGKDFTREGGFLGRDEQRKKGKRYSIGEDAMFF